MTKQLRFDGRAAIVTGAGGGLGRAYALLLAERGARVVVNDLGGGRHGEGASSAAADRVVAEIIAAGGEAVANYDSVEDGERIVQTVLDHFGRVDIVINNAGILRDVSFHKMEALDWDLIYRVHLLGAYKVTRAAWPHMREQRYGRVIMTSSAAGIYGNFGQANYSAAKLALVGLANTLAIEGEKRNIHVNAIAPVAGSRMTETILPADLVEQLKPEYVAPLVVYLCHERTMVNGELFEVGAGWVSRLRWQRSKGAFFPLSKALTPEIIADGWPTINNFDEPDYPTSAMASFDPITANLKSADAKTRLGNEFIDVEQVLGFEFEPRDMQYGAKELSLYALSIGAAKNPVDPKELRFVYELSQEGQQALPTFAVTFPFTVFDQIHSVPGLTFNPMMLLHGEQYLELKRPLPISATVTTRATISQIYDKGSGVLAYVDCVSSDENGDEIAFNRVSVFIRGIGNYGGERGPSGQTNLPPERVPDAVVEEKTSPNQALLYRLSSGDGNPLHADPAMAALGGFDQPILHGLCTFGFGARAVLKQFAENDPARFKSIQVRFTKHVFPGETLITEMWRESDTRILFQVKVAERDEVVLSNAVMELHPQTEVETAVSETAPAATKSQGIFAEIDQRIAAHPQWIDEVGAIYQFEITGEEGGLYVVDLQNAPGGAKMGENPDAGCKLTMTYDNFRAMLKGELKPEMAFMSGKLKVSGNMLLATKLGPLFSQR